MTFANRAIRIEELSIGEQYLETIPNIFLVFSILAPSSFALDTKASTPPAIAPAISPAADVSKPNTLLGTSIKLRIGRNISSADAKLGEHVDFEVLEAVQVQGVVVVAKGATASATVTEAQPKRRMGREGKLGLNLDYVRLGDDQKAALTATAGGKGGTHTGAMVGAMAATAIFTLGGSALFLLMHGKDITITKGAETTAYINGDMPLDMARFAPQPAVVLAEVPATNGLSQLSIDASVANCDVELDGAFVGSTPSTVLLASGDHTVRISKKGYQPYEKKLHISGLKTNLHANMDAVGQ